MSTRIRRGIAILSLAAVLTATHAVTVTTSVQAATIRMSGGYKTSLSTRKDKSEKYYSYAKKLVIKSGSFTVYGSTHYTKPGYVYSTKIYAPAKRTYILSKSCKFYKMAFTANGPGKKVRISKKTLKKLALPLDRDSFSYRNLDWKVKGGKVVEVVYWTL